MFSDVEGAESFYGDVLGRTFGESSSEHGGCTRCCANGKAVAAVVPPPGREDRSPWCLCSASPDAAATAGRIREAGGELLLEPMRVGDLGTVCLARDPGGVVFGVWQGGTHEGFGAMAEPGAHCWAEVFTREPGGSDAFFPAVFSCEAKQTEDEHVDFRVFGPGDRPVLGRMRMTEDFPPEAEPRLNVCFTVPDCDEAVARATGHGVSCASGPWTPRPAASRRSATRRARTSP